MSEERSPYRLNNEADSAILNGNSGPGTPRVGNPLGVAGTSSDLYALRAELMDLERRLIPLLIAVQRALGKEPSIVTRLEKRSE
jgi:hypothetical protein